MSTNRIHSQYKYRNYVDHIESIMVNLVVVELMSSSRNRCALKRNFNLEFFLSSKTIVLSHIRLYHRLFHVMI